LRIAADQSGDEQMLAIFHSGEDYHLRTARMIAPQAWPGVDPQSITKESNERTTAKGVNFGVLYDDDVYGLAFRLGLPIAQAQRIRDALFGRFKKLDRYIKDRVQESNRTGCARTWWDGDNARRRWLTPLGEVDEQQRKTARRGSWNTPIQGTGSDYLLAGLVEVVNWINSEDVPAQVCVPIHDAILSLVREDVLDEYLYVVPRLMTSFPTRSGVPLVVDGKIGKTWGGMEKIKLK
jgi:DNA polymerase-1